MKAGVLMKCFVKCFREVFIIYSHAPYFAVFKVVTLPPAASIF